MSYLTEKDMKEAGVRQYDIGDPPMRYYDVDDVLSHFKEAKIWPTEIWYFRIDDREVRMGFLESFEKMTEFDKMMMKTLPPDKL